MNLATRIEINELFHASLRAIGCSMGALTTNPRIATRERVDNTETKKEEK